jgi:hypothetical protein
MVFPQDEAWRERFRSACRANGQSSDIDARVRTWELERYFFRGVAKFMPWVRTIHLILDSETQVPEWLDTDKVHVVYHRDIMPDDLLPTFNSQAIEMWLNRIPGLSSQFIYCNDDMIACSPMKPKDFFHYGKPVIHCEEKMHDSLLSIFRTVCRRTLDMVAADYGIKYPDGILLKDGHSYAPMLLSTLREAVSKYGAAMRQSCTPFREQRNMIQYLYTYMQWLSGRRVDGHHAHRYFSLGSSLDDIRDAIRSGNAGICCFNDSGSGDWHVVGSVVREELQSILPLPCKYEKQ